MRRPLHGFDLTFLMDRPESVVPVFACLMQRIIAAFDGKPTIIVLHEAWDLIENDFFAPRLESLMEMLKEHNALVIFATEKPMNALDAQTFDIVMRNCATHLYVPGELENDYSTPRLGLNEDGISLLSRMDRRKGDFLVRQGGDNIALRADTATLPLYAVLSGDSKSLTGGATTSG